MKLLLLALVLGVAALLPRLAACAEKAAEACWLRMATAASNMGAHAQAVEALKKVAHLRGRNDPELNERIAAEGQRAVGGTFTE